LKKLLQIIILTQITACGSIKNRTDLIADEKFELCSEIKYNRLLKEVGPTEGKLIYKQNIHSLLENALIQDKYLTEISKSGYSKLLEKVSRKEIKPEFFEKLKTNLGFDPYSLFLNNSHLSCYEYLFEQLNVLTENSWQYKSGLVINNKAKINGDFKTEIEYLIYLVNRIPKRKFELIIYRKLFLDYVYTELK
jgi:hypothetical protein